MTPLLDIADLRSGYGAATHVGIPALTVRAGRAAALVGPNGAGKTATVRAILGLNAATASRLAFDGIDLRPLATEHRVRLGIAYVPQGRRVFPGLTLADNLHVAARVAARQRAARLDRVFAVFPQLAPHRRRRAWRLSGGQQQMLAIARALMGSPRLLLLDEPTLGLAPKVVGELYEALAKIAAAGTAMLITEQDAHRLPAFCEPPMVLENGAPLPP